MKAVFRKVFCLVLVIAVCGGSLCSCSFRKTDSAVTALNNNINSGAAVAGELHNTQTKDLSRIASSGLIELHYDARTCSVAVYDTSASRYWTALPACKGNSAAMLNVVLLSENGRYYMNSQDNSVAFSACSAAFLSDGVRLTYVMSDDASVAAKEYDALQAGELWLRVTVEIRLIDGSMTVNVPAEGILASAGVSVESITLLPDFGAIRYSETEQNEAEILPAEQKEETTAEEQASEEAEEASEENPEKAAEAEIATNAAADFLLVPDGCGAVMYTRESDSSTARVSFRVYGEETLEDCRSAQVPAFGIRKAGAAFVAVIGEGADGALIKANRGEADLEGINRVCAEFPVCVVRSDGKKNYISPASGKNISVCYRFMSGSEASYISMAASCREYLIRQGLLSSRTAAYEELPLNIAIIGSADGGYRTLSSDLVETEDLLSVVKAKGVNSVNLILQGFFDGGLLQDSSSRVSAMRKTGGSRALDSLCDYAQKQKFNVFAGLNILTASSAGEAALTVTGEPVTAALVNPLAPYIGKTSYKLTFLASDRVERNVVSLMNSARGLEIAGFCINDAARYAYADRSRGGASAADFSEIVAKNVSAFAIQQELMLCGCHFNVIKDASFLLDVPFYTQYEETVAYAAVPFIPAILHSTVGYSGTAANTALLPTLALLKCVEYGGIPYFEWVLSMKSHLYYGLNLTDAVEFANRAAEELSDLSGTRMTGHECIESGVYATEYDCGSVVYVNYNNYSVSIGNLSVAPYDYIRLN